MGNIYSSHPKGEDTLTIKIKQEDIKVRKIPGKPTSIHRDRTKYHRKSQQQGFRANRSGSNKGR